jgi:hypothetical protein
MRTPSLIWIQRFLTALLTAGAVGSVVFWVLRTASLPRASLGLQFTPESAPPSAVDAGLVRALGGAPVKGEATPVAVTMTLVAVLGGGRSGAALIAINGESARRFWVGDEVQPGRYLLGLGTRTAQLGASAQGPVTEILTISVPELPSDK